ncbi:proline-rich receptor-like protein kinase PERK9 [Triticum dicoccoides]|uniref:proline-rich receptor-like protein kinase PERK9 n=1 Tax=Triticum dicoccoides TaxID=85692 RepID=UPI0018917FD7|nr:proline-rich receptor-like protein kinase PERK9 [Triticum dicoccoides]
MKKQHPLETPPCAFPENTVTARPPQRPSCCAPSLRASGVPPPHSRRGRARLGATTIAGGDPAEVHQLHDLHLPPPNPRLPAASPSASPSALCHHIPCAAAGGQSLDGIRAFFRPHAPSTPKNVVVVPPSYPVRGPTFLLRPGVGAPPSSFGRAHCSSAAAPQLPPSPASPATRSHLPNPW